MKKSDKAQTVETLRPELVAAGRLAWAVERFLNNSDMEKRIAGFTDLPRALQDYNNEILNLGPVRWAKSLGEKK